MTNNANNDRCRNDCQLDWQNDLMQERISAFVDSELQADEFEGIRQHVATCQSCAQTVEQYRKVDNQLLKAMSRPQVSRPAALTINTDKKNSTRELTLPNAAASRHWLATGTLAAAGVAVLAAFATGTFSSGGSSPEAKRNSDENPFTQTYMTNVVAPLGEMALNNEVYRSQQKRMVRTCDFELRLLRLNAKNISNDDGEVQRINDEIESLMKQVQRLDGTAGTTANDVPAL